jgi:hypothetical protein
MGHMLHAAVSALGVRAVCRRVVARSRCRPLWPRLGASAKSEGPAGTLPNVRHQRACCCARACCCFCAWGRAGGGSQEPRVRPRRTANPAHARTHSSTDGGTRRAELHTGSPRAATTAGTAQAVPHSVVYSV